MEIPYAFPEQEQSIIKVIGVGGGGGNAVNSMFNNGIKKVDFIICNTDIQVLEKSPIPKKIRMGFNLTHGLGCGANPEVGKKAALESIDEIREILKNNRETRMLFVTAGMGGGTGTGAAPVIAALAKDMGILTVGIVTTPFDFEGGHRMRTAKAGIKELEKAVDTLLVINNTNILKLCPEDVQLHEAYSQADLVLHNAAKGIAEIITIPGFINVDFADVETIMKGSGTAIMGMAIYDGKDRAKKAIEQALSSPLLDNVDLTGAAGVLVNISTAEHNFSLGELRTIGEYVQTAIGQSEDANTIIGHVYNNDLGNSISVTVIVTGFNKQKNEGNERINAALNHANQYLSQNSPNTSIPEKKEPQAHHNTFNSSNGSNVTTDIESQATVQGLTPNIEPVAIPYAVPVQAPTQPMEIIAESTTFEALEFTILDPMLEDEPNEALQIPIPTAYRPVETPTIVPEKPVSNVIDNAKVNANLAFEPVTHTLKKQGITPEERIARIRQRRAEMDLTNPKSLQWVENTPAYLRRNVDIDSEVEDPAGQVTRYHIKSAQDGKTLFSKNPYIYDNVD